MAVHHYPMPARFLSREMTIKNSYDAFEQDLIIWMRDSVTHNTDKAEDLVCENQDLQKFYSQVRNIASARMNGKSTIRADVGWGVLPSGRWQASHVDFFINASNHERQRAAKDRLLEVAESDYPRQDIRKIAFPAEDYDAKNLAHCWHSGQDKLRECFKLAYNSAKKDAELPENPFENPLKDSASLKTYVIGKSIEKVPGMVREDLEPVGDVYNTAKDGTQAVIKEDLFTLSKLAAEHVANRFVKGAEAPFVEFFELALGGMCDAAISGQAGRVAKIRSHAYVYFTYGLLHDLTYSDVPDPRSEAELKYYVGGRNVVRKLISTPRQKFDVQVALMHYAAENATGAWEFKLQSSDWVFQVDYIRNWTPQLLGRSLLTQLCQHKYLVD